jgi:hypothetical protein
MSHQVTVADVAAHPTAVVAVTTTWQEFPTLWKELLDEVWTCLRAGGIHRGCRNVMLYRDDVPHVEVGDCAPPSAGEFTVGSQPLQAVVRAATDR